MGRQQDLKRFMGELQSRGGGPSKLQPSFLHVGRLLETERATSVSWNEGSLLRFRQFLKNKLCVN